MFYKDYGAVTGGSSGGALFNQNNQIVGQLYGGWSSCASSFSDRYGKLSRSWSGGGTTDTRLSSWLSPTQDLSSTDLFDPTVVAIQGNDAVACTASTQYTVTHNLFNVTYDWQVSSNLTITGGWGTSSISVSRVAGANGPGTITLTIKSLKGINRGLTRTKQVTVGIPTPTITAQKSSAYWEPTTYLFTASTYLGATYNWYVGSTLSLSGPSNTFDLYFPCNSTKTVKVSLSNSDCGTSQFSNSLTFTGECIRTKEAFTLSPNPASSTMTVSTVDAATSEGAMDYKITGVKIFDQQGNLKKQRSFDRTKKASMNISDLPSGLYIIEVSDGDYKEQKQLLIQK